MSCGYDAMLTSSLGVAVCLVLMFSGTSSAAEQMAGGEISVTREYKALLHH